MYASVSRSGFRVVWRFVTVVGVFVVLSVGEVERG